MKKYLLFIFIILFTACDWFKPEKEKVTITNEQPVQGSYSDKKKGDTQSFSFDSNSELGLPLEEFYRVDGKRVDNDNQYTHTFDKKGVTTIEGVAKTKEDSSKVTWMYTIDNQSPTANDKAVTMDEESTKKIPESQLGSDPDGDDLEYNVTNTSAGVNAQFKNGNLEITGLEDFFGNANVNYNVSDGEGTDNGKVNITINNIDDPPTATNVSLTPLEVFVGDTLWTNYDYNDVENDLEGNTIINQYINNQLANTGEEMLTNDLQPNDRLKTGVIVANENGTGEEVFSNEITLQAKPYSIISGRVLDTDTQEINASLLAWVVAQGDTAWANTVGEYQIEVTPTENLKLQAGYKTLDKATAKSFVTTIKDINANTNTTSTDIAVVTYDNMNTTPEEYVLLLTEANSEDGKLRALRKDMSWNIYQTGRYGETYSEEEISAMVDVAEYINSTMVRPLPINIDRTGWYPTTIEEVIGKIIVEKWSFGGLGTISSSDEDNPKDGRIDGVAITTMAPVEYPGATREEFASAVAGFNPIGDIRLAGGKTIYYEYETIDEITSADTKSFTTIQCLTDNIGGLYPYMLIEDILNIQQ